MSSKSEQLALALRDFVREEYKHKRRTEKDPDHASRDDVDFAHAEIMNFTVKDCNNLLALVRRREKE